MQLFKFKSFDHDGLLHMLDMIVNERIYLSTCGSMNDANEGNWTILEHQTHSKNPDKKYIQKAERLREIVDTQRYTCFVEAINHPLMWAHYAGGFSGVAFAYNLDNSLYDIRKIDYLGTPIISLDDIEKVLLGECMPQDIGILKQKVKYWKYEDEWRLYNNGNAYQYIYKIKPTAIILGGRSTKYDDVFRNIVRSYGIKLGYMLATTEDKYKIQYIEKTEQ